MCITHTHTPPNKIRLPWCRTIAIHITNFTPYHHQSIIIITITIIRVLLLEYNEKKINWIYIPISSIVHSLVRHQSESIKVNRDYYLVTSTQLSVYSTCVCVCVCSHWHQQQEAKSKNEKQFFCDCVRLAVCVCAIDIQQQRTNLFTCECVFVRESHNIGTSADAYQWLYQIKIFPQHT